MSINPELTRELINSIPVLIIASIALISLYLDKKYMKKKYKEWEEEKLM
jgi:hypothetical protein